MFPKYPTGEIYMLDFVRPFPQFTSGAFQFARYEDSLRLSNRNLTITKSRLSYWSSAVVRGGLGVGEHYWEVHVDEIDANKAIMIGVTNDRASRLTGFYQQVSGNLIHHLTKAWAYYSYTGEKYHSYKPETYADPFTEGDLIGVYLVVSENNTASIGFYKNQKFKGTAFHHLTGKVFWPFVDLHNVRNRVTMRPSQTQPPPRREG